MLKGTCLKLLILSPRIGFDALKFLRSVSMKPLKAQCALIGRLERCVCYWSSYFSVFGKFPGPYHNHKF